MTLPRLLAPLILLSCPVSASADWALMSQHERLEGKAIAYVGQVSQESKYMPDAFENVKWYEFKRGASTKFCFDFSGHVGLWGLGEKPAIVLVDKDEQVRLALFESSIGNINVEVHSIVQIGCPSPF